MGKNRWKWIGTLLCSVVVLALAAPQLYGADSGTPVGGQPVVVAPPPGEGPALVRVYYGEDRDLYSGVLISFNVLETDYQGQYHVVQATPQELERLQAAGLRVEAEAVRTLAQYYQPRMAPSLDQTEAIPGYSCYRTVEETYATAQSIVASYPDLATWTDVGDSWQKTAGQGGYDMMVLVLTNSAIPGPKPKLFVTSAIHAREYATAELVTRFAEQLVNNYGTDPDATWLIDHHEIHLMLHANPDGRKQAETGLSWRKNTNDNYCSIFPSYRGADLNRNFEFHWGCCGGSSGSQCDATYRGPSAASEPETQAIQNYGRAEFPDQRGPLDSDPAPDDATGVYLDIHASGKLLLWAWGHTPDPSPNATQLQTMGRKLAYWNDHEPKQGYGLYPTDGTTKDFGYGELGLASFVYELGTQFFESCSYFESTIVPDNIPSLIYAAKVVRTPYMTPAGPDAMNLSLSDGATAPGVTPGTPVTLQATVNDTRYNNSNGTEPAQNVAAAEVYVDDPPWVTGATAVAMSASDGIFDATIEGVTATIDTAGLSQGQHLVYVRGQDVAGNWGAFSAVFLYISASGPSVSIVSPAEGGTVAGPAVLLQIDATDAEDPAGTLTVEWNVDGGAWQGTTYNGVTGYYEADWDTTTVGDGGHTLNAQATDSDTNVGSDSNNVTVDNVNEPPVASFTYNCTGLSCDFDASGSYDPDGTIVSYDWDYGDGSPHGSGATASHTYATAGTYTVILTVTDDDGATDTDTQDVTVSQPPVATFTFTCTDLSCDFDASGSYDPDGTIVGYDWDYGDGSPHGSGVTASHTYAAGGTYTVILTVTDDGGATGTDTQDATVNAPPVASFTFTCTGLACDFDGSGSSDSDGTIVSYEWDFGDTNTGSGATASHTYATPGTYTVVLTVTDDDGATDTDAQDVTVSEVLTVHVGDLDGLGAEAPRGRWDATVTITVHDGNEDAVSGALVEGAWSGGATGGTSCTTDADGQCSVSKGNLKSNVPSVTWTVSNVTSGVGDYVAGDNHDPDGDSDGTTIIVSQPAENSQPTVNITAPSNGANFASGATIDFSGTASDAEDGDLTASLIWTSDIDGQIGTGGSFSAVLSDGVHTITASVTDSGGASGSDSVGITVGNPPAVHVGDLDGVGAPVRSKWEATVTITVHDQNHAPLANATVSGTWSAGATGGAECTTDGNGQCSVVKGNLKLSVTSVTFTVDGVTHASYAYASTDNHDPDGDSDGTSIVVSAP